MCPTQSRARNHTCLQYDKGDGIVLLGADKQCVDYVFYGVIETFAVEKEVVLCGVVLELPWIVELTRPLTGMILVFIFS